MHILFCAIFAFVTHAEVGFHFFDQASPKAVAQNGQNVFELFAPAGPRQQVLIKNFSDEELRNTAEQWSTGKWRPDIRIPAIMAQLQFCRAKGVDLCDFAPGLGVSTAFLLEQPHVIVATFHGISDTVESLKKLGYSEAEVETLNLPLTLLDANGTIVRAALPGLHVRRLLPRALDQGKDLSVFVGDIPYNGIPYSRQAVLNRDGHLYAIGFPGVTQSRATLGKQDAKLDTLAWTTGGIIDAEILMRTVLENICYTYDSDHLAANPLLVTDLDGVGGLSGGAVVNEEGFVIGVVTDAVYTPTTMEVSEAQRPPPQGLVVANLLDMIDL